MAATLRLRRVVLALALGSPLLLFGAGPVFADPIPDPQLCDPITGYCAHIPLDPALADPGGYYVGPTNPHPPVAIGDLPPIQTDWIATPPALPPEHEPPLYGDSSSEDCMLIGETILYMCGSGPR